MQRAVIDKIVASYGLGLAEVSEPQSGYRNSSYRVRTKERDYNLILFKREPKVVDLVRLGNDVGSFLQDSGLPARVPADERILRVYEGDTGQPAQYAGLYNYLPGSTIAWDAYTRTHILHMGQTMSDMHAVLYDFPAASAMPRAADTLSSLIERITQYLDRSGVQRALESKLGLAVQPDIARFGQLVSTLARSQRQQMLHMDFVRGNVLFDQRGGVSGIIDFEKASVGHPLFDIARTLAFLIVDCTYKDEDTVVHTFLNRGYQKRGRATIPRIRSAKQEDRTQDMLNELVTLFLVHDLYKFLLHNPYESLPANHHFVRTRDQLIKRNVLKICQQLN